MCSDRVAVIYFFLIVYAKYMTAVGIQVIPVFPNHANSVIFSDLKSVSRPLTPWSSDSPLPYQTLRSIKIAPYSTRTLFMEAICES